MALGNNWLTEDPMSEHGITGAAEDMNVLHSRLLFTMTIVPGISRLQDLGQTSFGQRYFIPIDGGEFEGPRLRGAILPDGLESAWNRPDGTKEFDVQFTLKTHDEALIRMRYAGMTRVLADADTESDGRRERRIIRTLPRFETSASDYLWLNSIFAVAQGRKMQAGPIYKVFEIL
jgi:hypothetical protein